MLSAAMPEILCMVRKMDHRRPTEELPSVDRRPHTPLAWRATAAGQMLKPSGWRTQARTYRRGDRHVSIKNEPSINFLRSHLSECEYPACSHAYHRKWRTGLRGERFNRINTYYVMEKINEHRSEAVSYRQRQRSADR